MGLDNGIYIKGYRKKPFYVKDDLYEQSNQIDLAYWRKYWGLRNDIINIIYENYYGNNSEVLLSENQIKKIRNLIMEITFSKKRYLESCSGYWDYNIYSVLRGIRQMINLTWAARQVRKNPEVEVFWYDSY
ncbi:MAG: hypothetical protein PUJ51_19960 [Clostridiales bacterium]|nr:hypothetical protein [Clostridiales bacterium]